MNIHVASFMKKKGDTFIGAECITECPITFNKRHPSNSDTLSMHQYKGKGRYAYALCVSPGLPGHLQIED